MGQGNGNGGWRWRRRAWEQDPGQGRGHMEQETDRDVVDVNDAWGSSSWCFDSAELQGAQTVVEEDWG